MISNVIRTESQYSSFVLHSILQNLPQLIYQLNYAMVYLYVLRMEITLISDVCFLCTFSFVMSILRPRKYSIFS